MAIGNPRIHMICGLCGTNKEFTYKLTKETESDKNDNFYEKTKVIISCNNCGTLTCLDELIEKEEK